MLSTTVTCPICHVALRSNKPLPANKSVRCPDCGQRFQTPAADSSSQQTLADIPVTVPRIDRPEAPQRSNWPLVAALCALCLVLVTGLVVAVVLSGREQPKPAAVVENPPVKEKQVKDPVKDPEESNLKKELEALKKQLRDEQDKRERKERFEKLLADAQAALGKKEFDEAAMLYRQALKLFPEDKDALSGLADARASGAAVAQIGEDKEKRQAEYNRLMTLGKDRMTAKEYPGAVRAFEGALALVVADQAATTALDEAQKALAQDKAQKDALALQQARKFQDAKEKQAAFNQELDLAQTALTNNRPQEAMPALTRALAIFPNEPGAMAMMKQAQKQQAALEAGQAQARGEFQRVVTLANTALLARRYEEAMGYFRQADQMSPGSDEVRRGYQAIEKAQLAQQAYFRYMNQGATAFQFKRYPEAVQNYREALRLVPGDVAAQARLLEVTKVLEQMGNPAKFVADANQAMLTRQWKVAIKNWEAALQFNPNDVLVNTKLAEARYNSAMDDGRAAFQARRFQDALAYFQEAARVKPGDFTATSMAQQAQAFLRSGRP